MTQRDLPFAHQMEKLGQDYRWDVYDSLSGLRGAKDSSCTVGKPRITRQEPHQRVCIGDEDRVWRCHLSLSEGLLLRLLYVAIG